MSEAERMEVDEELYNRAKVNKPIKAIEVSKSSHWRSV